MTRNWKENFQWIFNIGDTLQYVRFRLNHKSLHLSIMKSPRRCCKNSFCSISFPIFYSNSRKNSKLIALKMWEMPRILTEKQKTTFKLRIMLCCLYCKSYICRRKIQPYSHIQPDGAARYSPTFVLLTKTMRLISNLKDVADTSQTTICYDKPTPTFGQEICRWS